MSSNHPPHGPHDPLAERLGRLQPARAAVPRDRLFYQAGQEAGRRSARPGRWVTCLALAPAVLLAVAWADQHQTVVHLRRQIAVYQAARPQVDHLASEDRPPRADAPPPRALPTPADLRTAPGALSPARSATAAAARVTSRSVVELLQLPGVARRHFEAPPAADRSAPAPPPPTPLQFREVVSGILGPQARSTSSPSIGPLWGRWISGEAS